jgi:glycosyltransferase involved in cell wall biosynthesis
MERNRRIRVLLYVPGLELGGAERYLERIACGLDPERFEPVVGWCNLWGPVGERLQAAGIAVHRFAFKSPATQTEAAGQIRELAPDIFHSFSYSQHANDVLAAEAAGVPTIVSTRINMRDFDTTGKVRDWEFVRNRRTHHVTAVSEAVADLCAAVEGVPRAEITVIHGGVEIPLDYSASDALRRELQLDGEVPLVGYVGNYRFRKAHDLLLRAFQRVRETGVEAHLVCCGTDVHGVKATAQTLAKELGVERAVTLLDTRMNVDSFYRALDVYTHPSLSEGFSNAIVEAMAYGLPVVAAAVGGTPEAVTDGVTGVLVNRDDPEALAAAIGALLRDPQRRKVMGMAGRERAKANFSVRGMIAKHEQLYEELLSSQVGRPDRQDPDRQNRGRRSASAAPVEAGCTAAPGERIRILYHLDYLWAGGLEKKAAALILGLDRRRFDPMVSWGRKFGVVGMQLRERGVPVMQINPQVLSEKAFLVGQIRDIRPHIFHSFSCNQDATDVSLAAAAGVPVILTNRGSTRHWNESGQMQEWEIERNRATRKIIACSHAVAAICARVECVPLHEISVIYNGVKEPDLTTSLPSIRDQLKIKKTAPVIGYTATYRSLKAHEILLRTFQQVNALYPESHLICCGEEYDGTKQALQSLAAELNLRNISLFGRQENMDAVYRGLDIYAHPSLSEGFSNSILEAMAHGLPVVASAVGGNAEAVVDGVTGMLVPAGDAKAMAQAITVLVRDASMRKQLGDAGRLRAVERFSLAAMVSAYQDIYEEVLAAEVLAAKVS